MTAQPPAIDKNILAGLLLEWAKSKEQLSHIEEEIKNTVLTLGETVVSGSIRATYNTGRKTYDYEQAVRDSFEEGTNQWEMMLFERTTTVTKLDWRGMCHDENIEKDDIPFTQADPSVTIKEDK